MKNSKFVNLVSFGFFILMVSSFALADNVSSCDYVISVPGEYIVNASLFAGTGDCIEISSSDVVLDCAGFVLDGNLIAGASGISVIGVDNVTVRNCEVFEFDLYGVLLDGVTGSVFEDLVINGSGYDADFGMFDEGGLSLASSNGNLFDNVVVMNDYWDNLYLYDSADNVFMNSLFDYSYNNGATLYLSGNNTFDNVTISTSSFDGIDFLESNNNIFKNSLITGADDAAIGGVGIFIDTSEGNLFYSNVFDNPVNADISIAGFENFWNTSTGNYWYGFSDSCADVDNDGICDDDYDVSEGALTDYDYMPFDNIELWNFARTISIEFNATEWNASSTDFSFFSDEELASLSGVVLANDYGSISFLENISILGDLNLSGNLVISNNSIFVNSTALPEFNKSAELRFYGLGFDTPRILRDGVLFDGNLSYNSSSGLLVFNVTGFSEYTVEEEPVAPPVVVDDDSSSSSGSSSSGSSSGRVLSCESGYHLAIEDGVRSCVVDEDVVTDDDVLDEITLEDEADEKFESAITGNVVNFGDFGRDWRVVLGILVLVGLFVYFVFMKKNIKGDIVRVRGMK
jgi:hypothetical protein